MTVVETLKDDDKIIRHPAVPANSQPPQRQPPRHPRGANHLVIPAALLGGDLRLNIAISTKKIFDKSIRR